MSWLLWAFALALLESGKDLSGKRAMAAGLSPLLVTWSSMLFSLPFMAPSAFLAAPPDHPCWSDGHFWFFVISSGLLNALAFRWYMEAIHLDGLSRTVPLITLTPAFLLITSPLMVGEHPSHSGAWGVLLLVIGTWMLNRSPEQPWSLSAWWQAFRDRKGFRLMLRVALLWSVTANIDKLGIAHGPPPAFGLAIFAVMSVPVSIAAWRQSAQHPPGRYLRWSLALGLLNAASVLCHMTALAMTQVPYLIAIKRSSTLFTVLLAGHFFGESHTRQRLAAAVTLFAGMVLILVG
ncbi:MAG: EamA family transporter [Magnetococcales bacterium]|nr:EamA family transporter [Magnetococcales bacterium]